MKYCILCVCVCVSFGVSVTGNSTDIILPFYFKFLIKSIEKYYKPHTYVSNTDRLWPKYAHRISVATPFFFFPDYLQ